MSTIKLAELQREAAKGGYAIPHFLGANVEMILGAIRAGEEKRSPLAIGFAPEVFPMVPLEMSIPLMAGAAKRASVPVATQLEHGKDFDTIARAIQLGMTSVMFDGSHLRYDENIKQTREVVKMAHAFGVSVEGELGCVGGSAIVRNGAPDSEYTDPDTVPGFLESTGVDSLAISFGNFHGIYKDTPSLDFDRVKAIRSLTDVPLVMHGGSGLTGPEYRRCIQCGISNIHFYTYLTMGLWDELRDFIEASGAQPAYHHLVDWTVAYFYEQTKRVIEMLGSAGKA